VIKRNYPDLKIKWTAKKREKFIIKYFNLKDFFEDLDGQIKRIEKRIKFLELYTGDAPIMRINPRNFLILVWSHIMRDKRNEEKIEFGDIAALLNWFSLHRKWSTLFESKKIISPQTPRLTYNKYIKFAKNDKYEELSTLKYNFCFPDIAEAIEKYIPNPLDYIKIETEYRYIRSKRELEGIFK